MSDVVVTVPKKVWAAWIAEGDAAGDQETGEEWAYWLGGARPTINPGERVYVVAHGRLRGYAPLTRLIPRHPPGRGFGLCRRGGAVPVTIPVPIDGFQGWRYRWWDYSSEVPFPNWKTEGTGLGTSSSQPRLL